MRAVKVQKNILQSSKFLFNPFYHLPEAAPGGVLKKLFLNI